MRNHVSSTDGARSHLSKDEGRNWASDAQNLHREERSSSKGLMNHMSTYLEFNSEYHSLRSLVSVICLLVADHSISFTDNSASERLYAKSGCFEHNCRDNAESVADLNFKRSSRTFSSLKREDGFGTAQIWYQQSMATGTPKIVISLEFQKWDA